MSVSINRTTTWTLRTGILIVLGVNLTIAFLLAFYLQVRTDEIYSLHTTSQGFAYALQQSIGFEGQPPVYFQVLSFFRLFSESVFMARLLSILCGLGTLLLVPAIARQYTKGNHTLLLTALFAVNPYFIYWQVDIRCYGLALFLSAAMLYVFHQAYISDSTTVLKRILFAALAVAAILTHYYCGFLLAAFGLVLLYKGNRKSIWHFSIDMILPVVGIACVFPHLSSQVDTHLIELTRGNLILDGIAWWAHIFKHMLLGDLPMNRTGRWIYRIVLAATVGFFIWKERKTIWEEIKNRQAEMLLIFLVLAGIYTLIWIFMGKPFVAERYLVPLFIPFYLVIFSLFTRNKNPKWVLIGGIAMASFFLLSLFFTHKLLIKEEDFAGVATYVESHEKVDQPILIYRNEHALSIALYYTGKNELIPLPIPINFEEPWGHERWAISDEKDFSPILQTRFRQNQYFWLITHKQTSIRGVPLNVDMLESFVNRHFEVEEKAFFKKGLQVRLLKRK